MSSGHATTTPHAAYTIFVWKSFLSALNTIYAREALCLFTRTVKRYVQQSGCTYPIYAKFNIMQCRSIFNLYTLYFAYIHRAARVGAISLTPEDNRVGASSYLSGNAPSSRSLWIVCVLSIHSSAIIFAAQLFVLIVAKDHQKEMLISSAKQKTKPNSYEIFKVRETHYTVYLATLHA